MGKWIAVVIVAMISWLTYLAYKSPRAYHKIFVRIIYSMYVLLGLAVIWDFSNVQTIRVMLSFVPPDKSDEAAITAKSISILDWPVIGGFFLIQIYLMLLDSLRLITGREEAPPDEK